MKIIYKKEEAVDLLLNQHMVAIFQGHSEWGARALGNRSLLFDPRNKNAKLIVNKIKQYSDCKNVILSGGYHMNCSNNFKLVKHFPKYSFFVDPVAYDGGTAIGAALYYENYL